MAIYDRPVRLLMREMVTALGMQNGKSVSKEEVLAWFAKQYPKIKQTTISAHLIYLSTNAPSRVHHGAKPGEDDLLFQIDGSHFRLYDKGIDPTPIYEKSETSSPPAAEEGEELAGPSEFAYESDLRGFLAKNLSLIEPGFRLYQDEGITGIEFPAGGRFIDILAVDSQNNLVVIELKVSRGYDRVVGQLLRYVGWIAKHQAEPGQKVRGIIVARDITEDLILACAGLPDVQLYEYQLSVSLRRVHELDSLQS